MVLCGKLLKVLFTIGTKQQVFDGKRMMQDVQDQIAYRLPPSVKQTRNIMGGMAPVTKKEATLSTPIPKI
ncbi:hypothetical protein HNR31_003099 [Anoxybacillus caldiproteolyticus]|uniref:Uncharacterized protein n=1 Tax=Thermaerobacillus caldiproteolyticus TaxID=247480 RepID=A0A7V9Z927_9BACL|nr:hypothetical protein [Anoxybacillus caldiproteolyticus]MBA2876304.1 hypothetical protein [Anoxybacillus caldiproteolyticus]